jgi:hypothetical protein
MSLVALHDKLISSCCVYYVGLEVYGFFLKKKNLLLKITAAFDFQYTAEQRNFVALVTRCCYKVLKQCVTVENLGMLGSYE